MRLNWECRKKSDTLAKFWGFQPYAARPDGQSAAGKKIGAGISTGAKGGGNRLEDVTDADHRNDIV